MVSLTLFLGSDIIESLLWPKSVSGVLINIPLYLDWKAWIRISHPGWNQDSGAMGDTSGYSCSSVVWGLSCKGGSPGQELFYDPKMFSVGQCCFEVKPQRSLCVAPGQSFCWIKNGRTNVPSSELMQNCHLKCSAVYYWSCITSNCLGSISLNSQRTLLCSQHLVFVLGLLPANLQGCLLCWKQRSLVDVVLQSVSRHLNELLKIAYPFPRKWGAV